MSSSEGANDPILCYNRLHHCLLSEENIPAGEYIRFTE